MPHALKPSEILKSVIQALNTDTAKFSREIGFARPDNVYKVLEGKANPSWDTLIRIASRYEEVSADFLLRGRGDVIKGHTTIADHQIGDDNNYQKNLQILSVVQSEKDLLLAERERVIQVLKEENTFLKSLIPKPQN